MKSKPNKVNKENSNKKLLTKYVRKADKEDADKEEGVAVVVPKPKQKKKSSIVALKHKAVLDRIGKIKNDGKNRKVTMYEAMIEEGYSPEYARQGGLRKSKAWDKLLEERLGDDKLSNVHQTLIVAKKLDYMLFNSEVTDPDIYELIASVGCTLKKIIHGVSGTHVYYFAPDNKTKKDALELAYKIRGKMSPEVVKVESTLSQKSDEELQAIIKKQVSKFTKKD